MAIDRDSHDWEKIYQDEEVESMGWFHPDLDLDFDKALNDLNIHSGIVLDLCTGPGTQAMALTQIGFEVTAVDISRTAIDKAKVKAKERNLNIHFTKDNILDIKLDQQFDIVFDRGCFHGFPSEKREDYVNNLKKLVKPDGYLFLKCFSYLEESDKGPYRFTPEEIKGYFSLEFKVCSIKESAFQGTVNTLPKALFCILQKYK